MPIEKRKIFSRAGSVTVRVNTNIEDEAYQKSIRAGRPSHQARAKAKAYAAAKALGSSRSYQP